MIVSHTLNSDPHVTPLCPPPFRKDAHIPIPSTPSPEPLCVGQSPHCIALGALLLPCFVFLSSHMRDYIAFVCVFLTCFDSVVERGEAIPSRAHIYSCICAQVSLLADLRIWLGYQGLNLGGPQAEQELCHSTVALALSLFF